MSVKCDICIIYFVRRARKSQYPRGISTGHLFEEKVNPMQYHNKYFYRHDLLLQVTNPCQLILLYDEMQ